MSALAWVLVGGTVAAIVAAAVARALISRSQDRLARRLLEEAGASYKLLTRAERSTGWAYRRLPGLLGLTDGELVFHGVFGETESLPTSRIQKVVTGTRLSNGRQLVGREVLRLTRTTGEELEFVLTRSSASAWRSHLGLWAVEERRAALDVVTPGKT